MAVTPFENLSGDPSLDWMGPVLARAIVDQLTASAGMHPVFTEDAGVARSANIARVIQGYYTGGEAQVRAAAVLRDIVSQTDVRWLEASNPLSGTAATAEALAKALDASARPFGTRNAGALKAWGESMGATEAPARAELLERAIASDPDFGAAYADLIQVRMAAGDRDRALDAARRADQRLSNFTDLDRARVELIQAGVRGDQARRRNALVAFSRLAPTDLGVLRSLADLELSARRFDAAVEAYRKAVALDPENPALLNQLGYAEAYAGNANAAREAMERYRAADPDGLNPVDSLGEVRFIACQFAEAEKYFLEGAGMQAGPQGAVELVKAAQARFLLGNTGGADELYGRYEEVLKAAKNPLIDLRRAQWLYITDRRQQAIALAQSAMANSDVEAGAYARAQAALWRLDAGDRQGAAGLAGAVLAATRNPGIQRMAALIRSAADGSAAPGELGSLAQAYAALLSSDFPRAASLLKPIYEQTPPAGDGQIRTLYAWALAESGKQDEARALLSRCYIPLGGGSDPLLTTQAFPHFVRLRSTLGVR